jgi:hypothetical protein
MIGKHILAAANLRANAANWSSPQLNSSRMRSSFSRVRGPS